MKNQKGFSLVELLVVVIIIAIIAAIAIPSLLASRRAANEASAISSLRTVHSAQATFQATLGNGKDYAATLAALGPASSGPALIDSVLAGGTKSGYTFANTNLASSTTANGRYCAEGHPSGSTLGTNTFGVDDSGVVIKSTATTPATVPCSAGVLDKTATAPIG